MCKIISKFPPAALTTLCFLIRKKVRKLISKMFFPDLFPLDFILDEWYN